MNVAVDLGGTFGTKSGSGNSSENGILAVVSASESSVSEQLSFELESEDEKRLEIAAEVNEISSKGREEEVSKRHSETDSSSESESGTRSGRSSKSEGSNSEEGISETTLESDAENEVEDVDISKESNNSENIISESIFGVKSAVVVEGSGEKEGKTVELVSETESM